MMSGGAAAEALRRVISTPSLAFRVRRVLDFNQLVSPRRNEPFRPGMYGACLCFATMRSRSSAHTSLNRSVPLP